MQYFTNSKNEKQPLGQGGYAGQPLARRFLALLLVCFMGLALLPLQSLAANPTEMTQEDKDAIARAEAQRQDLNRQTEELAKEQRRIASEQKTVLGEMKQLSNQIEDLEKEIDDLNGQIKEKLENIEVLTGDIEVKTAEVNQRNDYMDQRLNQIYTDGDLSLLDVLFESTSLTDFLTRYDLMEKVVENDADLLNGLRQAKAELEEQKLALETAKIALEERKAVLDLKNTELSGQWAKQNKMSQDLAQDLAMSEAAEDELNALSDKLVKFIASIQAKYPTSYMGSGTLGWPVPGRTKVSSPYGYRIHPIYKTKKFHTGIDIPAPSGTPAVASDTGKVIMATTYGGFGKTVILDHGGGVATQYSHLVSISVSMGDIVPKGAKVGGVGTTGVSTGNHLHYQIMINGKTVDPLDKGGKYFVSPK